MSQRHNWAPQGGAPGFSNSPAPLYRSPGSIPHQLLGTSHHHATNAALLIDFDNVTMGIRSDLQGELKNLLASDIIKGKVSVQRAYADWRRYPQYIVPLAESSIDMIMAPAYGSSKKNATDIRLAIDALELVFTRPEIGTFILLSGDSDFSSLVIKLKEYGKYVIGVGIRESSSDLLVMNCDEYYSYNSLAGLVKSGDEEFVKRDPWELAAEGVQLMKTNGDVMRADRLKQVMQNIDPSFDESNLGMAKFSRFVTEAANRQLLILRKLDNGQLEVDVYDGPDKKPAKAADKVADKATEKPAAKPSGRQAARPSAVTAAKKENKPPRASATSERVVVPQEAEDEIKGEKLPRDEAFALVRDVLQEALNTGKYKSIFASKLRAAARKKLDRDSASLSERNFVQILKDAHDAGIVDMRRRGNDFEVSMFEETKPIADQVSVAKEKDDIAQKASAPVAPVIPRGMGHRGVAKGKGGRGEMPADLLSIGVVGAAGVVKKAEPVKAEPAKAEPGKKPAAKPALAAKRTVRKIARKKSS